jgi:hypothetical protein
MYINWETGHYNSVLEITVPFLGIHKWEPDIYFGFSSALHLQCVFLVATGLAWIFMYYIQHCSNCRPSDSTMSEDAGLEHRTVETLQLKIRRKSKILKVIKPKINL